MSKILRVLLFTVMVLALVVPMTVSAQVQKNQMVVSGKIYNGTNGGPESPVTVRLYRDTGAGDVLIREETYEGRRRYKEPGDPGYDPFNPQFADEEWDNTFSAMGDFLFMVNCVRGFYTVEIDAFMEGGADAVGVKWYYDYAGTDRGLLKKEAGEPGPWTFSFYNDCNDGVPMEAMYWANLVFEYSSVAGPRANAGWMYVAGTAWGRYTRQPKYVGPDNKIMTVTTPLANATVMVQRVGLVDPVAAGGGEDKGLVDPWAVDFQRQAVTGAKGHWGMGLTRHPGYYRVWLAEAPVIMDRRQETIYPLLDPKTYEQVTKYFIPQPHPFDGTVNPIYFQVFDVYGSGGWDEAYGPGSAWLPWNFMQPEWVYDNLNFMVWYMERPN